MCSFKESYWFTRIILDSTWFLFLPLGSAKSWHYIGQMYKRQLKSSTCKRRLNVYFFINFLLVESLKNLANQQSHSGSNNVINFRNTKQAKNSWPSFGYVKKSRVKKSVSKRVVWCLIPLKIFLFFLSLCHSRNAVRMQQWVETKFKNSEPLP